MRKNEPIEIVVHGPSTDAGWKELARRAARVHAQAVESTVEKQRCSVKEKIALLRAVERAAEKPREPEEREL